MVTTDISEAACVLVLRDRAGGRVGPWPCMERMHSGHMACQTVPATTQQLILKEKRNVQDT